MQVVAGLRRTESSFETFVPIGYIITTAPFSITEVLSEQTQTSEGWGGVGQASISYNGEVTNATFTASRDIMPASGQNGTTERTAFTLSAARRLSYDFRGGLSTQFFINKSGLTQFATTPINVQTFSIAPAVRYEFGRERAAGLQSLRDMYVEASYIFSRVEDKEANTTANRNLFLIRFFAQHALLE